MNPITQLHNLGQSVWYDNIQRRLLENGELSKMIANGEIRGITSNPSIFQNAIAKSHDYDQAILPMAWSGWSSTEIFYQLAYEDIREAADLFHDLYEETNGGDGYVSLEVSPFLAHDTKSTIAEARRLWDEVNRPNLMIKIPATVEGIPAIRQAIKSGINVNVTLIFSLSRYASVMNAYLQGLEDRLQEGLPIDHIASVASFFVSRVDTKVDEQLQNIIVNEGSDAPIAAEILGKIAIANAKLAYEKFCAIFSEERFLRLKKHGANRQRPLWASTSTKNPAYPDVMYVNELIGPHTVNTVPPKTIDAFRDHGTPGYTLTTGMDSAHDNFAALEKLGIDIEKVTQDLEDEGVKAFADAFTVLLQTIEDRSKAARSMPASLLEAVKKRVNSLETEKTVRRLFAHDSSLWTTNLSGQKEIEKRLGWLDLPQSSQSLVISINQFVDDCRQAGYTHTLLLGMGGSSLAPEVLQLISPNGWHKPQSHNFKLRILDSTDPRQVESAARWSSIDQTLYIVSSKSGTTAEVNAFLGYFWDKAVRKLGSRAGEHFIAITDPGTELARVANEYQFRRVFEADAEVGGRYSALSAFGLVPAGFIGYDVERLLNSSQNMARDCQPEIPAGRNPGAVLGAIIAEAALTGRDKLTLICDESLAPYGSWLEQLIAESSGKSNEGIIPVDGEPVGKPTDYGDDRLFVYLRANGQFDQKVNHLKIAGHPVISLTFVDEYSLGGEFYRWEIATAVACAILGINGFNQPDVQDSKTRTNDKITLLKQTGVLDEGSPIWQSDDAVVYGDSMEELTNAKTLSNLTEALLSQAKPGEYVAINAFLPRNSRNTASLTMLRTKIRKITHLATTVGFGPRFLHSTGQLHKGGPNKGLFIQITSDAENDLTIPGQGITFGQLERAQALADKDSLTARGRRVLRIHLKNGILDAVL